MSRLPYPATKVVDASLELTIAQKWLWFAIWQLDRGPERAFISATLLARRKGVGVSYVEQVRRELKVLGILDSGRRPGRNDTTWWPLLPAQCIPMNQKPTDEQIFELADRLDGFLRIAREDTRDPEPPERHTGVRPRGTPGPASMAHPGMPRSVDDGPEACSWGEGREGGSALQEVCNTSPTSCRNLKNVKEVGEEVGARARAKEEAGGTSSDMTDWRTLLEKPETTPPPVLTRGAFRGLH